MSVLERIHGHEDLAALDSADQLRLCWEIRAFLISSVAKTGGHLASNLGVVELTVAIETVFDTNKDRLVFDVGHQSYIHKLLTGRQADFDRLRQYGGMAGFPKPSESQTDAFVAGHASSSVSIALGMARARKLTGQDYDVVALVGDGAATGGMIYEGLNDAGDCQEPMIIILNDNEMSIDRNVGGFARHLSRLRTKERYLGMKESYKKFLSKIPGGKGVYRLTRRMKSWLKRVLLPTTIFENMGVTYLGPVDGHDLPELIRILRTAKEMKRPVLIHVMTQKGRGYLPAEEEPSKFHGVGRFDESTGQTLKKGGKTFSDVFGDTLTEIAREDNRVCAITAAMPGGTGLLGFKEVFPDRLFDVGIAEEHAVSMAGGLAKQGAVPVVALYSTFLQRSYDQILQDIAILKLHVVLAVDRAGLVGEDGETHHGVFDVGFLRQAPGMTVLAPASTLELSQMLRWAIKEQNGPVAIRYPRGGDGAFAQSCWDPSRATACHLEGDDCTIVTYGTLVNQALEAAAMLKSEGISACVLRLTRLAPLLDDDFSKIPSKYVLVMEEVCANSGLFETIHYALRDKQCRIDRIDLGDGFVTHGKVDTLYKIHGLDAKSVADRVKEGLRYEN